MTGDVAPGHDLAQRRHRRLASVCRLKAAPVERAVPAIAAHSAAAEYSGKAQTGPGAAALGAGRDR
jgi:hypothetical protein